MALRSISGPTIINFQPSRKESSPFLPNSSHVSNLPGKRPVSAKLEVPSGSSSLNHSNALVENTSPSASSFSSKSEDNMGRQRKHRICSQPHRQPVEHESGWSSMEWSQGDAPDRRRNSSVKHRSTSQEAPRKVLQPLSASTSTITSLPRPLHRRAKTQLVSITNSKILAEKPNPFKRWMSTLRRAGEKEPVTLRQREHRWALDESAEQLPQKNPHNSRQRLQRRTRSSSATSSALVNGVTSASISLVTVSAPPTSRTHFRRALRSSENSSQKARSSIKGYQSLARSLVEDRSPATSAIDQASFNRAIKRRNTLDELVQTEESYVADLKVLVNVCTCVGHFKD